MRRAVALLCFAAAASGNAVARLVGPATAIDPPPYIGVTITGDERSEAHGLNNAGSAVGCLTSANRVAFIWRPFAMTRLGPGCAYAVNNHDDVAGVADTGEAQVWWHDGTTAKFGAAATVRGINDSGVVVGSLGGHAFRYGNGTVTMLPEFDSTTGSEARGINNRGQILLQAGDRVYIYDDATGSAMEIPRFDPATPLRGQAINDQGKVLGTAGYITTWRYPDRMPCCAERKSPGYTSGANAMNNRGDIVRQEEMSSWVQVDDSDPRPISSTIDAFGYYYPNAAAINDRGWLFGNPAKGEYGSQPATLFIPRWDVLMPLSTALRGPQRRDVNRDGTTDVLWWLNPGANEQGGWWSMKGLDIQGVRTFSAATDWVDLIAVTRNPSGGMYITRDANTGFRYDAAIFDAGGASSSVRLAETAEHRAFAGAGDFDGDGEDDLLWWLPGGRYEVWLMSGATAKARGVLASPANSRHAIIADFDGDGRDDIVWVAEDGHYELTLMNGLVGSPAGTIRPAGTGFYPHAVGDFNGDHKADIVWKNPDGRQSLWLMDGATTLDSASLLDANTGWRISHVADLNGDGKSDLVWEHFDGTQAGWLMDGTRAFDWRYFMGAGTGWRIQATADLDGNGTADLVWKHTDGTHAGWLMRGLDPFDYRYFTGPTSWALVP